jgi:hypothetical protein
MDESELHSENILCDKDNEYGYIFEVDLDYPDDLHNAHNDCPLAINTSVVEVTDLSSEQQITYANIQRFLGNLLPKERVFDLYDKKKYICLWENLQFYISKGLRVSKIHKGLKYKQSVCLKDLVEKMAQLRARAKLSSDMFIYNLIKQLLVSIFGNFLADKKNYVHVKPCFSVSQCRKYAAKHNFETFSEVSSSLTLFKFKRGTIRYDRNIIAGCAILERSKLSSYSFFTI